LSGRKIDQFVVGDLVADDVAEWHIRITPAASVLQCLDSHALLASLLGDSAVAQIMR